MSLFTGNNVGEMEGKIRIRACDLVKSFSLPSIVNKAVRSATLERRQD